MKKNIPNMITSARILLTIPIIITFITKDYTFMMVLTIISALTDWLDGLLARSLHAITPLGAKLDAISDKLFALTTSLLVIHFVGPVFIFPLILEGIISGINVRRYLSGEDVHSKMTGKVKTWFLFITMILGVSKPVIHIPYIILYLFMIMTLLTQLLTIYDYKIEENRNKNKDSKKNLFSKK